MCFAHQRDMAVFEALDDPNPPHRFGPVKRAGHRVGSELSELFQTSGSRKRCTADVEIDVEVRVLDPHGVVKCEWREDQPASEWREQVQSRFDEVAEPLEGVPTLHR